MCRMIVNQVNLKKNLKKSDAVTVNCPAALEGLLSHAFQSCRAVHHQRLYIPGRYVLAHRFHASAASRSKTVSSST